MFSKFNKIVSLLLTIIFITGIFPPVVFAQPTSTPLGEVKGFNRAVIDSHFSRADRELNPERWLAQAEFGVTQAICAWELIAGSLYENPLLYEEAKIQIVKWSDEELEKRFSQWLMGRFFGKAAEEALLNLSSMLNDSQKNYSWHLDEEGNVIFDDKTGDPLVIRPNEEGREFSHDLTLWRNETDGIVKNTSVSFNNVINNLYPELLAYIPTESRESISTLINETFNAQKNVIKREFENIAAREERIFTNRRTRDIWSLRKKSDDEAAKIFTEKLIAETDESCKRGIEELNARIEQASAGAGDLALLGDEWLRLYKEQFERGLKAWEDAEERFFIRRIEWEQDSFKLFSEGESVWLSAFNQFEEERQKWELSAKELFQTGETLFKNISKDFEKTIADAKKEFELNASIRIGEGTIKVKALIDMYLVSSSAAISSIDNINFWQKQFNFNEIDVKNTNFNTWILSEMNKLWKQTESAYLNSSEYINDKKKLTDLEESKNPDPHSKLANYNAYLNIFNKKYSELFQVQEFLKGKTSLSEQIAFAKNTKSGCFPKYKFEALIEIQNSYNMYLSYMDKSLDARNKIYENYTELFETGAIKDILSSNASSDDFYLDEYQIALIRAKALVLYWERKTSIAEAVMAYASELSAGRMTEAEGIKAWEEAKAAYNKSLTIYETELNKLNKIGDDIQEQQKILNNIAEQMQKEEEKLNALYSDYSSLISMSVGNLENFYSLDFDKKYNSLVEKYNYYQKTGVNSIYYSALEYGLAWENAEQRETAEEIRNILKTNKNLSREEITELNNYLISLSPEYQSELWNNTYNSLSQLFSDYDLQTTTIFPDAQSFCFAIFSRSGDFMENTAKFMTDFDNCLPEIHTWLQYEINNWKESIINYIATFAFFNNIQPEKSITELADLYDDLLVEYNILYRAITDNGATDQMNIALNNTYDQLRTIIYIDKIYESWEQIKLTASTVNEKHWRQYLLNEYITDNDSSIVTVSSWEAGILEDALYYASYYTNRINDSLNIYSYKDMYITDIDSEILNNIYAEQISKINLDFNLLNSQYDEIINAVKLLEYSRLTPDVIKNQLSAIEKAKNNQESVVKSFRNRYFTEANIFINIGSQYDNQYNVLKTANNNIDQKRFEYEKQDAIQRWASTSYINTDNINPAVCKENLLKAQTVLNVLSDISNNTKGASNNNPKYEALYAAYEQSFFRNIKVNEAVEILSTAYTQERMNNTNLYQEYQKYLFGLGINFNYQNYNLPESKSEWKIENIITIKNGRLAFSRDGAMNLIGVNSTEAMSMIDFFCNTESVNGEYFDITDYEASLRGLSQRLSKYLYSSYDKFTQWAYARNYLLLTLKNKNNDVKFLNNYLSLAEEIKEGGTLGSSYIKLRPISNTIKLSYYMEKNFFIDNYTQFQDAWNGLSAEEKADLEFYTILTLTTGSDYFAGFKEVFTYKAYEYANKKVLKFYREAQNILDTWFLFPESLIWLETRDVNRSTYKRIEPPYLETINIVFNWIFGLNNNLTSIKNLSNSYNLSCKKLYDLEGIKTEGSNIVWDDINKSLLRTKMKPEDIATLQTCWKKMQTDNANMEYKNVFEAIMALQRWSDNEVYYAKNNLETRLSADIKNQQINENNFLSIVDDYLKGTTDINSVKTAANNAYGENAILIKRYLDKMYNSSINNLSVYMKTDQKLNALFNNMGEEIISLTEKSMINKYRAELTAREVEWEMMRKDITDKYDEWQNTAAKILENGRTDWTESYKKLESAYKQWNLNFQSEYERVNNEWTYAYLAGLEDKEEWLRQASDAANQASQESFLSLIGSEGERLSRFMDTREPLGIRDAVPQAQALMSELLQSSGIVNMAKTFTSLNNFTNVTSPLVKRGIGGTSTWDSAFAKIAASDLARKTNSEISKNESKKLAYNARITADEAIKGLYTSVDTANQNTKKNMDNIFIFKGLWKRNGDNYVKDIIKGSTLFEPVVSKTVTVIGYKNYIMEPVTLKTNLDENYLTSLDTIAIQGLINNVYNEVQTIVDEIFGIGKDAEKINKNGVEREQSPGKFGTHIGYGPAQKELKKSTTKRNEIFLDEGEGEMGHLLSDYYYWDVIDKIGSAELALAPWDKRIWNDEGSFFTAPSLRTVGTIAGSIAAGIFSGGTGFAALALSVGLSSASEIAFGTLDLACGYKSIDEVAFNIGKSVLTNAVTFKLGTVFNGVEGESIGLIKTAVGNAGTDFSKVLAQTMMTGAQTFTTGFATSAISAITYNGGSIGFSGDIFTSGIKGMLTNSLVSMTSTFTSTGLTAINSGLDYSKLEGFNKLNHNDLKNLNGLIGSLAGQGVNYALGNDFTLNVLNLSLLSKDKYSSGLLELHLGRNGVNMNIGTGGANVSVDNLNSAFRGTQVWDVNNKIYDYGKKENFDALTALRVQYGYGDTVQKNQLWDILKGETLINTNTEGNFGTETTINEDGKKVINLSGYKEGMSRDDQYLLGVLLGYEAYRDGYTVGQTDASGEMYTNESLSFNIMAATIASMEMVERIKYENDWFDNVFDRFAFEDFIEKDINNHSSLSNNESLSVDDNSFEEFNPKGVINFNVTESDHQNDYKKIPLFLSKTEAEVDKINDKRLREAYARYAKPKFQGGKYNTYQEYLKDYQKFLNSSVHEEYKKGIEAGLIAFKNDEDLLKKYGYIEEEFISISKSGCVFMTTKYILEAILGIDKINTIDFHNYIIDNNYYSNRNLLFNKSIANIMTSYSNNEYTIKYMKEFEEWEKVKKGEETINIRKPPSIEIFNKIISSDEQYYLILQIQDPIKKTEPHFVAVKSIEYTKDREGNIISIDKYIVANPLNSSTHFNGATSFLPNAVLRFDVYSVTKN